MWNLLEILFFPRICVYCRRRFGAYLCQICKESISYIDIQRCPKITCGRPSVYGRVHASCKRADALDGAVSIIKYRDVGKAIVHEFKANYVREMEDSITEIIGTYIDEMQGAYEGVHFATCVPLYWYDANGRPYNAAEKIGWYVSKALSIPFFPMLLQKKEKTISQKSLSREERLQNVRESFCCPFPEFVNGRSVVLVDDVWTTGATVQSCTRILKRAGAKQVFAVTLARGI